MSFYKPFDRCIWIAAVLLACCGCNKGPPVGKVSGKITYKGQPVGQARIDFRPVGDGKQSVGYSDNQGQYEMQFTMSQSGALVGRHKVSVRMESEPGQKPVPVPDKYAKSQVDYEVKPGSNVFNIELGTP
jgi:hypothetical protein